MYSFFINLPIGAVVIVIILFIFKSPKGSVSEEAHNASYQEKLLQMDLIGASLILAAVVCLLLALQWGGVTIAWKSSEVIGTFVGFGLITIAFLVEQWWQGSRALLIPRILKKRVIWSGAAFSFL